MRAMGLRSEIFVEADHIHPDLTGQVHPVTDWDRIAAPGDGAILHYSIASPAFFHVFGALRAACAIHYHNITPADLLWRFAPKIALECAIGRRRLSELAGRVSPVGADSTYNAAELEALGFGPGRVLGVMRQPLPRSPRTPARRRRPGAHPVRGPRRAEQGPAPPDHGQRGDWPTRGSTTSSGWWALGPPSRPTPTTARSWPGRSAWPTGWNSWAR